MALDPNALQAAFDVLWPLQEWNGEEAACRAALKATITAYLQHAGEGEAEPVAWTDKNGLEFLARGYGIDVSAGKGLMGRNVPLFAAPHPHQVAEGMVLVPREPTDEMLISGRAAFDQPGSGGRFSEVYRAMIAAAPPSPQGAGVTEAMVERAIDAALDASVRGDTKIVDWLGFNAADAVDLGTEPATFEGFSKLDVVRQQQYHAVARAVLAPVIRNAITAALSPTGRDAE